MRGSNHSERCRIDFRYLQRRPPLPRTTRKRPRFRRAPIVIYSARRITRRTAGRLWLAAFRRRRPRALVGDDILLNGLPLFVTRRKADIRIGDGVVSTSSLHFNMVGLSKRCSDGAELIIGAGSGFSGVPIHCANPQRRDIWGSVDHGAASVVTRDVPPDEVWGGNPARRIRPAD
jgi:hypothetical protein